MNWSSRRCVVSLASWCMFVWVLLTWTRTLEQLTVGAAVSLLVAVALASLGEVVAPWQLLRPRRLIALLGLAGTVLAKIVVADVRLAARIWAPSRPVRSGMVVVPTNQRSDGGLAAVGLLSSLIVDNQLVDVDRAGARLQYHAVDVPDRDPAKAHAVINGPIERFLMALSALGAFLALIFVVLGAPDDAHSEVVVGAIALPVLGRVPGRRRAHRPALPDPGRRQAAGTARVSTAARLTAAAAVAVPLTGAVAAPLLARVSARLTLVAGVAALLGSLMILLLMAPTVFDGCVLVHFMGGWGPVNGTILGIAFAADPFGLVFAITAAAIGMLLLVYTLSELGGLGARETGGYACLFLLLIAGLIGAALTSDLFNLFVWFEVAALASYGLTGFFLERPIALEAAFKILMLTTLAGFAIFIGSGLLYATHGALDYAQLPPWPRTPACRTRSRSAC